MIQHHENWHVVPIEAEAGSVRELSLWRSYSTYNAGVRTHDICIVFF